MKRTCFPRRARRPPVPAAKRAAERALPPPGPAAEAPARFAPEIAEKVPLILFSYDLQRRQLVHCNRHCQAVLGHSRQELLDLGPTLAAELLHPDSRAELDNINLRAMLELDRDRALTWECRMRHRDGAWHWLRLRMRASAFGPDGHAQELMGSAEEINHHRATAAELRQSRYLLRQVGDLLPSLVDIYDLDQQRTTYVNPRISQLVGFTSEELLAMPEEEVYAHLMAPEVGARHRAHLAEVTGLPDGEARTIEFAIRHRDGSRRWLRSTRTPFVRDAQGRVISLIGVTEDITPQRNAEEARRAAATGLAEQHRLFREIIDALPHPVYLKDAAGHYQLANRAKAGVFGLTPEALVRDGVGGAPAVPAGTIARYLAQDREVLATGRDMVSEESHVQPDGRERWFSSVKRRFVRADGTALVLGVDSDITEIKMTQRALERAVGEAEVDAQAKQDFLANMSHEIRTPLHGIMGLTGVLAKTTLTASQQDYLRLLSESAEHLLTVLNDVLTTARLGAGKLHVEAAAFSPDELLAGCAALLRPSAREKGLRLRVEKSADLPKVLGDAHRLRQVLLNLVSNGIKFTKTGHVRLLCQAVAGPRSHAEPADTIWLQFVVSDTGVGIAPAALEKIFEPFTQAAASTDREYGGTGLGLSISEGLVGLLGGVLRVSSEEGQGSAFSFTLGFPPVAVTASVPAPAAPALAPPAGRVLLVEDNLVNSLLAETVLRNWGWQVTTAASGPAAIQLFDHRPFDLVLMDIQMPGMDGETAARALRAHPDPNRAATPVIALTARAQDGEAERLQATGFAGYLAKPYREEQLLETMHAVLAHRARAAAPIAPTPTTPPMPSNPLYDLSNVRQLVRNDDAIVRRLAWAFIETTPAILAALDQALTQANWEAVGDAAHHLKSSLDGLGVESLRQVIREVEAYGTTPPDPAHAAGQVAHVRAVTEQVMAALQAEFPEQR